MAEVNNKFVFHENTRAVWNHIFKPGEFKARPGAPAQSTPRYDTTLIFPVDSPIAKAFWAHVCDMTRHYFPGLDPNSYGSLPKEFWPFKSGDGMIAARAALGKNDREFLRGMYALNAHRSTNIDQMPVGVLLNGNFVDFHPGDPLYAAQAPKFYSGVEVIATIAVAKRSQGPTGLTCYIEHLLSLCRGDRIADGGRSSEDRYAEYRGKIVGVSPYSGANVTPGPGHPAFNNSIPI